MQLKIILIVLAAVLAIASAAPASGQAADISTVLPGGCLSKSVVDINENENEDLNDENSKIIVYPGRGRPPTVIVRPSPYGPILLKRPHKRSDVDDAENDDSKIILYPGGSGGGYLPPPYNSGRGRPPIIIIIDPYGRRGPGDGGGVLLKRPRKRSKGIDEDSKISFIQPRAGPRPRYPSGYPLGQHKPSRKPGTLEARPGMKKDKSGKTKTHHYSHPHPKRGENEEVDWKDDDDFADQNDDVKYSLIYPPSPYWDSRRPHIMST
ncbi:hypothetical protein EC957_000220 [Mortierella hygrophila]|uniref:Uncharacterized protein n=1 Tax=Mortierella hygrophila TaxID=979708 RepID=A0A9P6K7X4_9FUNG|nr:hypothetical protein EC957_000220 [Mortierella hygrophila]